ncbi:MAG TPA: 3'-5' exonuclease [Pirellulaceae bacterium]|nr:3'-5' exonuclease [Pirellulaceae bacterium]
MNFRIADTFTSSLTRLNADEQKAVKTTAFDLQMNPANPGMQFHKLDRAKDKNFWSVRVSRDIRIIVHKTEASLLLCYVDHHDPAYAWAERRKLETHPTTGAAQLVEIRETVKDVIVPNYVVETKRKLLFDRVAESTLLDFGVPTEWLTDVKNADEDSLFEITSHLPAEAAEALLELATGGTPTKRQQVTATTDPFEHPDAQRRFRLMANADELAQALDFPWEKWAVFLHPSQRDLVERDFNGAARVAGTAGTGKTVVALHRAVFLASKNPDSRVLLTTFNRLLADSLKIKLKHLIGHKPKVQERIEVYAISELGERLYASRFGKPRLINETEMRSRIHSANKTAKTPFSDYFLWSEWRDIIDAWQLNTWEDYRDVARLGRKSRLREPQRAKIWELFESLRAELKSEGWITESEMFLRLAKKLEQDNSGAYDHAIVDEAQDISVSELRFLAALCGRRENGLFFAGDQGQRIFRAPFSWKSLGVDVRGRSRSLKINYRTSHQIRSRADGLLPQATTDVDGNTEERGGTISAFDGPEPQIQILTDFESEQMAVADWIKGCLTSGIESKDIGIFVRTPDQFERALKAIELANCSGRIVDQIQPSLKNSIAIMSMHLAKGLEFRAVAVMACDDEILPLQERIAAAADDSDLEEIYNTERHLLYVACTRARDRLLVTGVKPASEFLDDLKSLKTAK